MSEAAATRSPRLRAVVVGAGIMGRWHADAIRRTGSVVESVVDADLERARHLARRHRGSRATGSLAEALAAGPDVAHVCTPPPTHADLVLQAIAAGVPVLVEKPLAPSATETASLLASAQARGVLVCPVHQLLFQRGVLRLTAHLARLGRLSHLDFVACSAGADGRAPAERSRIALEILPHPLSLIRLLLGGDSEGTAWTVHAPFPGELRVTGAAAGTSISVLVSMSGRPTRHTLRAIGAQGTAHCDFFHGFVTFEPGGVSRGRKIARPFSLATGTVWAAANQLLNRVWRAEPAYPGLRELIRRFYGAIRASATPPIPADDVRWVAAAGDAIARLLPPSDVS